MSVKRKREFDINGNILEFTPLGAGNEVGRSCFVIKFKGRTVMLDCGIHPAYQGLASLPYFDEIDPAEVDLLLVSHFHMDHCGAVPYFLFKTPFKGRVFMTHPTKAIYKLLLADYIKISHGDDEDKLYTEKDIVKSMDKIEQINYHQVLEHNGIRFWCYNAGHVLGAAMFMVEIAGVKILYSGDYSPAPDRHLCGAEIPDVSPDVFIVESTYGTQTHMPQKERERMLTDRVHRIISRGGRCLLPAFALGRAQELLLILEEYWQHHPELHQIPVYYASALAKKSIPVYQTYVNMMNEETRTHWGQDHNPFMFKHIKNLRSLNEFDDNGPCVIMAAPGMLQSGLSRELFERWCSDKRNGVILPGYCVQGTLARFIMSEPTDITTLSGVQIPLRLEVNTISFSAHSDFTMTSNFISQIKPQYVVLVHGSSEEMGRLRDALERKFKEQAFPQVLTPRCCETLKMQFIGETFVKAVGEIARARPHHGQRFRGVLVKKDFSHYIVKPTEISRYTQLQSAKITHKLKIRFPQSFDVACGDVESLVGQLDPVLYRTKLADGQVTELPAVKVLKVVTLVDLGADELLLEWIASPIGDVVADTLMAILMSTCSSSGLTRKDKAARTIFHSHTNMDTYSDVEAETLRSLLLHHYSDVVFDPQALTLTITPQLAAAAKPKQFAAGSTEPDFDSFFHELPYTLPEDFNPQWPPAVKSEPQPSAEAEHPSAGGKEEVMKEGEVVKEGEGKEAGAEAGSKVPVCVWHYATNTLECEDEALKQHVRTLINVASAAIEPIVPIEQMID
eukprot:GCRY01001491.1.p1 GENE.GCRY01001491.1~~GCRY01001491.1.p1  ORF type:complete len:791 (-),score=254.73 GCRY01001491.1:213-2585(-)